MTINGSPAQGVATGTALAAMTEVSAKTLPAGYAFEWTRTAYQEQAAAGQSGPSLDDGEGELFQVDQPPRLSGLTRAARRSDAIVISVVHNIPLSIFQRLKL